MATLKEQQQSSVQIKLDRTDRIYRQGDVVKGCVVVNSPMKQLSHTGIKLKINGVCTLQLSARTVGLFEAFYSSLKPQTLMSYEIDIASGGKLPRGETELPFEFPLEPMVGKELFETYHGVYITIAYTIVCDCTRSAFSRQLQKELEFIVEVRSRSASLACGLAPERSARRHRCVHPALGFARCLPLAASALTYRPTTTPAAPLLAPRARGTHSTLARAGSIGVGVRNHAARL